MLFNFFDSIVKLIAILPPFSSHVIRKEIELPAALNHPSPFETLPTRQILRFGNHKISLGVRSSKSRVDD